MSDDKKQGLPSDVADLFSAFGYNIVPLNKEQKANNEIAELKMQAYMDAHDICMKKVVSIVEKNIRDLDHTRSCLSSYAGSLQKTADDCDAGEKVDVKLPEKILDCSASRQNYTMGHVQCQADFASSLNEMLEVTMVPGVHLRVKLRTLLSERVKFNNEYARSCIKADSLVC